MASAKATVNHKEIRKWVEAHGGHPAHVKSTGSGDDPGILRIDFPGFSGEDSLERISWEEWFAAFDRKKLAHLEQQGRGRFNKLVARKSAGVRGGSSKKTASNKTGSKKNGSKTAASKSGSAKKNTSKKTATKKGSASKTASSKSTGTRGAKKSSTGKRSSKR